jgi:predicted HAD superfamily phosphohydrolase
MTGSFRKVFVTDCEGPVTKNDNAAELAEELIPYGHRFFAKISLYDDYLAEVVHKEGYKAGDTLRLILPFFKAFGVTGETMEDFSSRDIAMIPQADWVLQDIQRLVPAYIVSTSYSPYIREVCNAIGFPFDNAFCTAVDLDKYSLSEPERERLKEIHATILDLPDFTIPADAASPDDLSDETKRTVSKMDELFWEILPRFEIYGIIEDVNPVGGKEKARAIQEICSREGVRLRDVFYVGDSITDVDAFRLVRAAGGMALSFNGNDWAVKEATFAVTARNALPIWWLAGLFINEGLSAFEDLMISAITPEWAGAISQKSCRVRKEVRTEKIGGLG